METWTIADLQREIMKETMSMNGQEMISVERIVKILIDPRVPDHLRVKTTEMLKFLENVKKDFKTNH